jgi:hypothetical protein
MFAAHFAAGLAIRAAQPRAPAWAVLSGALLPDILWIGFAGAGIEPAGDAAFFDGWSHSVASIIAEALLFALCFHRYGRPAMLAIAVAVASHIPLDALFHPRPLALWPHAPLVLGVPDWSWGQAALALGKSRYWWIQLLVTLPFLAFYARASRRRLPANLIATSCLIVLGLHLAF